MKRIRVEAPPWMAADNYGAIISDNVGFTRNFGGALCQFLITVNAYLAAKICPKRLASPPNAAP